MKICNAPRDTAFSAILAIALLLGQGSASADENSDFTKECDLDQNGKINGYAEVVCIDDKRIEESRRNTEESRRNSEEYRRETEKLKQILELLGEPSDAK